MKAVAYTSGIHSFALGSDPDRQMARIAAYASKNGITIAKRFQDTSTTHESAERPTWLETLAYCRDQNIPTILIDFYERLSTDTMSGLKMVDACKQAKVDLMSCVMNASLISNNPHIIFTHQMMFAASEFQRGIAAKDAEVAL